jgi:anti-sigma factor RsiW
MFCDEVLDALEPIATGDVTADGRIAEHLATCPNCAAALSRAQHLERLLRERPAPRAPAHFAAQTLGRVRRARWRSDQMIDVGFNLAIAAIVVGVIAAVWTLAHRSGLASVSGDAAGLFASGLVAVAQRVAPVAPLYAGATALVVTALGIWWWAERDTA